MPLPTVEERLSALEDREAIRSLIASYGPLADNGDATGVAALWTEDGSYAVGGMAEAKGRSAIAALIHGDTHRALMAAGCAHLLGPVAIDLDGDRAVARGHSVVFSQHSVGLRSLARIRQSLGTGPHGRRLACRAARERPARRQRRCTGFARVQWIGTPSIVIRCISRRWP